MTQPPRGWRSALALLGGLVLGLVLGHVTTPAPTPVLDVTPGKSGQGFDAPDPAPAVRAAVAFAATWGRLAPGQSPDAWHTRVRALATDELGHLLDVTDISGLPGARPSGRPEVRSLTADSAQIAVPLTSGRNVLITVITRDGRWLVNDVQDDVGN